LRVHVWQAGVRESWTKGQEVDHLRAIKVNFVRPSIRLPPIHVTPFALQRNVFFI
jgi:hypothetical protein